MGNAGASSHREESYRFPEHPPQASEQFATMRSRLLSLVSRRAVAARMPLTQFARTFSAATEATSALVTTLKGELAQEVRLLSPVQSLAMSFTCYYCIALLPS